MNSSSIDLCINLTGWFNIFKFVNNHQYAIQIYELNFVWNFSCFPWMKSKKNLRRLWIIICIIIHTWLHQFVDCSQCCSLKNSRSKVNGLISWDVQKVNIRHPSTLTTLCTPIQTLKKIHVCSSKFYLKLECSHLNFI